MAGLLTQASQQGAPAPMPADEAMPMEPEMVEGEAPEGEDPEGLYDWEEEATEEEQAAFEAAVDEASDIVYTNEQSHQGILKMIANAASPSEGYIQSVLTIVTELDKKLDLPVGVLPGLSIEVFNMIDDIATASGAAELTDEEAQLAQAGVQDGLDKAYGLEEQEMEGISESLSDKDVQQLKSIYERATNGQGFAA